MTSIASALARVKRDLPELLSESRIDPLCAQVGHTFRRRLLCPVVLLRVMILEVLAGNTAYSHLPHLAGLAFTAAAYCQAKGRLPLAVLTALLESLWGQAKGDADTTRFHGHRLFFTDGSSSSMPDTPELWKHFGGPKTKPGCGFPVLKFLPLFDYATGMIRQVLITPYRSHELPGCRTFHPWLEQGDLLVGDRAFCSYAHLALLLQQGLHGLFRLHQRLQVRFDALDTHSAQRLRRLQRLGKHDQLALYAKPKHRPNWISASDYDALPDTLILRELRYRLEQPGFRTKAVTLLTTLLDPTLYPTKELWALYGKRWQIEVNFRHLKTTLKMAVLKGQSPEMVQRELLAYLLVYNLVQLVMHEAARRQGVAPERISFLDTVRWLLTASPGDDLPELLVVPYRPGRFQPRVRKRRHNGYSYMTKPRAVLNAMLSRGQDIGCR